MTEDLISRSAAIESIEHHIRTGDPLYPLTDADRAINYALDVAMSCVENVPAKEQRKTGKWINDRGLYKCSSCNGLWAEWWVEAKPIERMRKEMPYCPMCGSYNGEEPE